MKIGYIFKLARYIFQKAMNQILNTSLIEKKKNINFEASL